LGRAIPYRVEGITKNTGWVSAGVTSDTAAFAVNTIRRWWLTMGCTTYSSAKRLMITADGGGSNGTRVRLWKMELQKLAGETGLPISVCHLPPGTGKWNKIEHRLFAFILNPAVEASRRPEIHLESTRSAVSAQAETHVRHMR
jgi:hypothetical protein